MRPYLSGMLRSEKGFTLVELLITMAMFVMFIAAATNMFTGLLTQFKQQSKIAESNIEGVVGLELLRYDIEQTGYGLPFDLSGAGYNEASNDPATVWDDMDLNDAPNNIPRAVVIGSGLGLNNSDVLALKATNIATNDAAQKWSYISNIATAGAPLYQIQEWGSDQENLRTPATPPAGNPDWVIALRTASATNRRILVTPGGAVLFATQFDTTAQADGGAFVSAASPSVGSFETYYLYGIKPDDGVDPRMPFNRADYYIRRPADIPQRCAPGTGILYKGTINHADGRHLEMPILDCVASMRVVLGLDESSPPDGVRDNASTVSLADAEITRDQVTEIAVYIIAHEGQLDATYNYQSPTFDYDDRDGLLPDFDLSANIGATYVNYRWKLYTLVITPYNLR